MKKYFLFLFGISFVLVPFMLSYSFANDTTKITIQVVTENYPPYNYQDGNKIKGVSTEVVRKVLDAVSNKYKSTISVYPWPRAYKMAIKDKNTIIYSITRTEEREKLFKWIGVVAPADNYFFSLKKNDKIKIKTLDDAKKYITGTVKDDMVDLYLIKKGFVVEKNIERAPDYNINIKKLVKRRIDLFPVGELVIAFLLKKNGYSQNLVKKQFFLDEISGEGVYMAFSTTTPDNIVRDFRKGLESIKKDGTYAKILKKYIK